MRLLAPAVLLFFTGCATLGPTHAQRQLDAATALAELQKARFDEAAAESARVLEKDPHNSLAHGVAAVAQFRKTMHNLATDLVGFFGSALASGLTRSGFIDTRYAEFALREAEPGLATVTQHLVAAAKDPEFSMELCLACWEVDWNRDGQIDKRDRQLLEVEVDANGDKYPEMDPRRRPTFRFDVADVHWLHALVAFMRAAGQVVLAYDFQNIGAFFGRGSHTITIPLKDAEAIGRARVLIEEGLASAQDCRRAVLAEVDDDREWLPNPRQKSHPIPLPVNDALFDTWDGVLTDLRALIDGKQGLPVEQLARLGDDKWEDRPAPQGYLDIGQMLRKPGTIVISTSHLRVVDRGSASELESATKNFFGAAYRERMEPSSLLKRFQRMKREVDRSEESFERKLRYLLWLN